MKIQHMYLDGFGHFSNQEIGPLDQRVTVFYGPNEAGKSTLLAFIRAILFGFPRQFRAHYPPLSGGRHGGRITVSDNIGQIFTIERFVGINGGLTVKAESGLPLSEEVLTGLLGQASTDIFKSVFAFSLDELQNDELLESDGVQKYIYSAGMGAPRLPHLQKFLSDRKTKIYRPSGRGTHEIASVINQLRDIDQQLKEIEGNSDLYGSLSNRLDGIDHELENVDSQLAELTSRMRQIENLQTGWEDFVGISECEAKLSDWPVFEGFPEDSITRLDHLDERVTLNKEDVEEEAVLLRKAEEAAKVVIEGEDLLEDSRAIEVVKRGRTSFDNSVNDLPQRKAELTSMEVEFLSLVRDLSNEWDESTVEDFDASIGVRSEVEEWRQTLADARTAHHDAQVLMSQEEENLGRLREEEADAHKGLQQLKEPSLHEEELGSRRAALRASRSRLGEYERARLHQEGLEEQLLTLTLGASQKSEGNSLNRLVPLLLGLLGICLIVGGFFIEPPMMLVSIVVGILLVAVAILLISKVGLVKGGEGLSYADFLRPQAAAAEESKDKLARSLIEAVAPLDLKEIPNADTLDSIEVQLEADGNALMGRDQLQKALEKATGAASDQGERLEKAQEATESTTQNYEEIQSSWEAWLNAKALPAKLAPDTMIVFLSRLDTARAKLDQVRQMRRRVKSIEQDIAEYADSLQPLAQKHGLDMDKGSDRGISQAADNFIEIYDRARDLVGHRDQAIKQAEEHQLQFAQKEKRVEEAVQALQALFTAGGANDSEEFRHRARLHIERGDLQLRHSEYLGRLQLLSGPGEKLEDFLRSLSECDPQQFDDQVKDIDNRIMELEAGRNAILEERGGIETRLSQLTSEEQSSALRLERNTLMEQLSELSREWSKLTLAEAILERARLKFERERQPGVVRHAERFFKTVTGQRYDRLYAPVGEQTITVMEGSGDSKQPSELSRGTREQLYLALRFGLIREFGQNAEYLPVIVDEVLVNFDPERAREAVAGFVELGDTNQVIVFTCHPSTVELFLAAAPDAEVINI